MYQNETMEQHRAKKVHHLKFSNDSRYSSGVKAMFKKQASDCEKILTSIRSRFCTKSHSKKPQLQARYEYWIRYTNNDTSVKNVEVNCIKIAQELSRYSPQARSDFAGASSARCSKVDENNKPTSSYSINWESFKKTPSKQVEPLPTESKQKIQ